MIYTYSLIVLLLGLMAYYFAKPYTNQKTAQLASHNVEEFSTVKDFSYSEQIDKIAIVLLKNYYGEFKELIESFKNENNITQNQKVKYSFLDGFEHAGEISDIDLLTMFADEKRIVLAIDWKGEYEDDALENFVINALQKRNLKIDWGKYKQFDKDDRNGLYKKGVLPLLQFQYIQQSIEPNDINLINLNDGSDQYYIFIADLKDIEALRPAIEQDKIVPINNILARSKADGLID